MDDQIPARFSGYSLALKALRNAITTDHIDAAHLKYIDSDFGQHDLNIYETLLSVENLERYVKARNLYCEALSPALSPADNVAMEGGRYAPQKLIAANKAWKAVTKDPALMRGRTPKKALEVWLTEHAAELGLLTKDGKPNKTGIEEICKVANWRPEGGATATPSRTAVISEPPSDRLLGRSANFDLDDDIPF